MAVELDLILYNGNTWLYPFAHLFTAGLRLMLYLLRWTRKRALKLGSGLADVFSSSYCTLKSIEVFFLIYIKYVRSYKVLLHLKGHVSHVF